jgi:hypothetical protein
MPRQKPITVDGLPDDEKLNVLQGQDIFGRMKWKSLEDKRWCLHCDSQFLARQVRFYTDGEDILVECGNSGCDGSPLDWARTPWWRQNKV